MDTHPQHTDSTGATHNHADVSSPANLVQSGAIHGGVHFHGPPPTPSARRNPSRTAAGSRAA
ncbi:hypothetical protein, partial [Nocardiopsis sp. CNR-923]|uniref:hypothetical protein n=1 Tax=Nocardiopsis sp. CNR-923 TaxID=1904965 RepID=UPI0021CCEF07